MKMMNQALFFLIGRWGGRGRRSSPLPKKKNKPTNKQNRRRKTDPTQTAAHRRRRRLTSNWPAPRPPAPVSTSNRCGAGVGVGVVARMTAVPLPLDARRRSCFVVFHALLRVFVVFSTHWTPFRLVYRVLRVSTCSTESHQVSPSFTGFPTVLPNFTEFSWL